MASFYALDDVLPIRQDPLAHVFACASSTTTNRRPRTPWAAAVGLAAFFASMTLASPIEELPQPTTLAELRLAPLDGVPSPTPTPDPLPTTELIHELLMDTRIPFRDEDGWKMLQPAEHELRRRAQAASATTTLEIPVSTASSTGSDEETATTSQSEATASEASTKTVTASTSASSSTASVSTSPLPTFFDGGLSNNFTDSTCPTFINNLIDSEEFNACYPVSVLLAQGSTSFFRAESSLVSISRVLDHACSANVTSCANYLATVASNLTKSENCGDDYDLGNPTVTAAYTGLVAYQVVYSATCLQDEKTSVYCFGDAVTNTTSPSETYFYFLPLNSSLPGGTIPTCGGCLQDTMAIYHVATANRKQPIASTYVDAAKMVDTLCGSTFANSTLAEAIVTNGAFSTLSKGPSTWLFVTTLVVMATNWLI